MRQSILGDVPTKVRKTPRDLTQTASTQRDMAFCGSAYVSGGKVDVCDTQITSMRRRTKVMLKLLLVLQ